MSEATLLKSYAMRMEDKVHLCHEEGRRSVCGALRPLWKDARPGWSWKGDSEEVDCQLCARALLSKSRKTAVTL